MSVAITQDALDAAFWSEDRDEESAREAATDAFWEAVGRNVNRTLPSYAAGQWPVSTYLGECSPEAAELLFAACHLACDPNVNMRRENAHLAAAKLRTFVEKVAADYADDHWEQWQ